MLRVSVPQAVTVVPQAQPDDEVINNLKQANENLSDAKQMGAEGIQELYSQGRQIISIEKAVKRIRDRADDANHVLDEIEFSCCCLPFKRAARKTKNARKKRIASGVSSDLPAPKRKALAKKVVPATTPMERELNLLESQLEEIAHQAACISVEVDNQNNRLERVIEETDYAIEDVAQATRRTGRV
tara:strand:+ start:229 stop:786 length:558 start_codon:yes stop_codon:yes gene_type:complete